MGFLHAWYKFSRKLNQAMLRYKIPVLLGIAFCIYWWNTSSIKWWGILGVGVMIAVVLTIYLHIAVQMEQKGEDMTAPVNDISEVADDASSVTLVQLAQLVNQGRSSDQIMQEAKKRGIGPARMKIAIAYQKHPFLMTLATLVVGLGVGLLVLLA